MNDILPGTTDIWQCVEARARGVLAAYGYQEIRLPIVEKTELYVRSIGEVTDIVEKEMYSFDDRNGESLTLRPEGTAGCVRAGIENGLLHNQVQRLWYTGPMFRHERPQKGRYRQFHQIGVEAFGMPGPDIDAELILMTARLWRAWGVANLTLQLNSLGTPAARARYREALVAYLTAHRAALDEDSQRRLARNPLRILDSKNPDLQTLIEGAPRLMDYLDADSLRHFDGLRAHLDTAGVAYQVNPRLVRGLDYYTRTVFEWVSTELGAQATVCAGGRYDGLVEQLGGKATTAAGFAIGVERLIELVGEECRRAAAADAYAIVAADEFAALSMRVVESLREAGLRVVLNCGGGSLKSQIKRADRSGARVALLFGINGQARSVDVKNLRTQAQETVGLAELPAYLQRKQRD